MSAPEFSSSDPATRLYQVTIDVEAGVAERVADALEKAEAPEAIAVTMFERGGGFEVSAHYSEAPPPEAIAALLQPILSETELGTLRVEALPAADWVTLSQGQRGPVRAGRFLVHGSHDRDRVCRNLFSIEIDASQAFGTAHHATTRGCLIALDDLLKRKRFRSVLDLGTGTGLLAIAAAKVLRRQVTGSDADAIAVRIAADNARKNGIGPLFFAVRATGLQHPRLRRMRPDLLLANLLARPLLELAPALARRLKPQGIAVLSGITSEQSASIEARYRSLGFIMKRRIVLNGWASLVLVRVNQRKA